MKEDISIYYDQPGQARRAEIDWILHGEEGWRQQLAFVGPWIESRSLRTVVEFGPGAGLLASGLRILYPKLDYLGIEKSLPLLVLCGRRRQKLNLWASCRFQQGDVRTDLESPRDLGLAFKFLKHFSLVEWESVLRKILDRVRFAAFDVQLLDDGCLDTGESYPHVYVDRKALARVLEEEGWAIQAQKVFSAGQVQERHFEQVAYWVEKRDASVLVSPGD